MTHIVEGAQLAIIAPNNHVVDVGNAACEVVPGIGCLTGVTDHLHIALVSKLHTLVTSQ